MVYGNIYDPEYRNKLLLKELKIAGQDDDDTNDNPDYTADDDTNNQADGGQEDNTQDTTEAPADNTTDDGGTFALGDDNDPNPDYTVDDTEGGDDGQDPAPDTQDAGGNNGDTLDMAAGDNTDGNPDYTADDTEGGDTGEDPAPEGDGGTLDMAAGGDDGGDNPDYTADDTEGGGDAGDTGGDAGTADTGGGGTLDMAAGDGGGDAGGGDNPDYTDDGGDGGDTGEDGGNTDDTANTDDATGGEDTGDDGQDPSQYDFGVDDQAKAIKNLELKQNYQQMYIACDDILTKISTITNYSDASGILRRVVNMTNDLKKYIEFYLTNTYNTKSYIDNVVNFQKYLTILNGIRNVLKDTNEGTEKDNKIEESVVSLFRSII